MKKQVNPDIIEYIETKIFPAYEKFDKGHNLEHITAVIDRALELAKSIDNLNLDIVYTAAALHDIGIEVERENHAFYSGVFVQNHIKLRNFFNEEEIMIIKEAVEDHSTSKGIEPRSIYGKIVCDADKDDNLEISLLRAYEFTKNYYPNYTEEECIKNVFEQLKFKFGKNGKVKFWINTPKQQEFLNRMRELAQNEQEFNITLKSIISKQYQKIKKQG